MKCRMKSWLLAGWFGFIFGLSFYSEEFAGFKGVVGIYRYAHRRRFFFDTPID